MNDQSQNPKLALKDISVNRRTLLCWSTPVVTAVVLPAHAQMSECMVDVPVLSVLSSPKCAGDPPIGQASMELSAGGTGGTVVIRSLSFTSTDAGTSLTGIPTSEVILQGADSIELLWTGPAGDAISCAPSTDGTLTVSYGCTDLPGDFEEIFNVTELLINSL